jgi:hypothetical protein
MPKEKSLEKKAPKFKLRKPTGARPTYHTTAKGKLPQKYFYEFRDAKDYAEYYGLEVYYRQCYGEPIKVYPRNDNTGTENNTAAIDATGDN